MQKLKVRLCRDVKKVSFTLQSVILKLQFLRRDILKKRYPMPRILGGLDPNLFWLKQGKRSRKFPKIAKISFKFSKKGN